jgi:hypothetical protein
LIGIDQFGKIIKIEIDIEKIWKISNGENKYINGKINS